MSHSCQKTRKPQFCCYEWMLILLIVLNRKAIENSTCKQNGFIKGKLILILIDTNQYKVRNFNNCYGCYMYKTKENLFGICLIPFVLKNPIFPHLFVIEVYLIWNTHKKVTSFLIKHPLLYDQCSGDIEFLSLRAFFTLFVPKRGLYHHFSMINILF